MSDNDESVRARPRMKRERSTSSDSPKERGKAGKISQNRVIVSNIPYEYRWQDIKDLFREKVGDVMYVELFMDENDRPKGSGVVAFADAEAVKKCIEVMQRYEIRGRKLVIKEDVGKDRYVSATNSKRARQGDRFRDDRHQENFATVNFSIGGNDSKWDVTYGLSPRFLESLNIDPPLVNKVFVGNLPYDIDVKKLKEVFRLAGTVLDIDIPLSKEDKSRGFAVIEYSHPVEAVQAISMLHNRSFMDRNMMVRMDRLRDQKLPEGLKNVGPGLGPNGEPLKNIPFDMPANMGGQGNTSILTNLQNNPLQLANALTGLGNVSALGTLATTNLAGASNFTGGLLRNNMGNTDLSSMVQNSFSNNPTVPTPQQNYSSFNQSSTNMAPNNNGMSFNVNTPSFGSMGNQSNTSFSSATSLGGSGNFQNSTHGNFGGGLPSLTRGVSNKVLVHNLPLNINYKLIHDKMKEFGDLSSLENKGKGSILITYAADWQAERAVKNLDKSRIEGRIIEARLYY